MDFCFFLTIQRKLFYDIFCAARHIVRDKFHIQMSRFSPLSDNLRRFSGRLWHVKRMCYNVVVFSNTHVRRRYVDKLRRNTLYFSYKDCTNLFSNFHYLMYLKILINTYCDNQLVTTTRVTYQVIRGVLVTQLKTTSLST